MVKYAAKTAATSILTGKSSMKEIPLLVRLRPFMK